MRILSSATAAACGGALLLLATAGDASAQSDPPPFDPVGTFTFTTLVDGLPVSGSLTITEGDEGYEGVITSDVGPPIPITSVTVDGQKGTMQALGPGGPLVIEFTATEDGLTGTWTMGMQSGELTARRTG